MKFSPKMHKSFRQLSVLIVLSLLVSTSAQAQISLRRALDYDGDGKADAAIWRQSDDTWYIQKSGGGFTYQRFGVNLTDLEVPGDYDGDGKGDIAVWRSESNGTGTFYFLRSSDNSFGVFQWGLSDDEPVARDFDGDGKTDYAVVRRTAGSGSTPGLMYWYIWNSNPATANRFQAVQFGFATDYVAPGDYDGDGRFDFGVQRPSDPINNGPATFYYLTNPATGTAQFAAIPWGFSNDYVAPGDYDGDGKTDITVVRDSGTTLVWYIRLSGSNGDLRAVTWGVNGDDLLAQNDYDGDGKTDLAVWRDSTGSFYILRSTNNTMQVINWGISNDSPIASYDTH